MCHNQHHNSQKKKQNKKTCESNGQFTLNIRNHPPACIVVNACCASGQRFSHQQLCMRLRQSNLNDSCTFLSRGERDAGISQQMRC